MCCVGQGFGLWSVLEITQMGVFETGDPFGWLKKEAKAKPTMREGDQDFHKKNTWGCLQNKGDSGAA